jgi:hypothetical protein
VSFGGLVPDFTVDSLGSAFPVGGLGHAFSVVGHVPAAPYFSFGGLVPAFPVGGLRAAFPLVTRSSCSTCVLWRPRSCFPCGYKFLLLQLCPLRACACIKT